MKHISSYTNHEFKIYIICQSDDGRKFNRGKLINIGFIRAQEDGCNIIIPHDVDLLPSDKLAKYYLTFPERPVHIARVWNRYSKNPKYFGGVVSISAQTYTMINGFPNNFWGWGGEDDEFYRRLVDEIQVKPAQPPTKGSYIDLEDMDIGTKLKVLKENQSWKCMNKREVLQEGKDTWKEEGLNSTKFKQWNTLQINPFCQFITVDILQNQHWSDAVCKLEDTQIPPVVAVEENKKVHKVTPKLESKSESESSPSYGFIFHFGIYSVYGYDDIKSLRRRKMKNGAEWYLERLQNREYRPTAGTKETMAYHAEHFNSQDYFNAIDQLSVTREQIRHWIQTCKDAGGNHVIITAKHHDGVCLWNTNTASKKTNTDIVKIFKEEADNLQMPFGIYYSWFEFITPFTIPFFEDICIPQINELLTYEPKYMWFDGDWKITQTKIYKHMDDIIQTLEQKNISFNDRIGSKRRTKATYRVFEDRYIPDEPIHTTPWQHINTIGLSWGYNQDQQTQDYKSGSEIKDIIHKVHALGGTSLFNLGPNGNGDLDKHEYKSMTQLKQLNN